MSSSILQKGQTRLSRTGRPCPNDSKDGQASHANLVRLKTDEVNMDAWDDHLVCLVRLLSDEPYG